MKPGRELDALVAEKVMEWKRSFTFDAFYPPGLHPMNNIYGHKVPHYSTSIADAWLVVEKLVKEGAVIIVKGDGLRTGDYNPKWTVLCDNHLRVDADTAPHAICLAALKAVGIGISSESLGDSPKS